MKRALLLCLVPVLAFLTVAPACADVTRRRLGLAEPPAAGQRLSQSLSPTPRMAGWRVVPAPSWPPPTAVPPGQTRLGNEQTLCGVLSLTARMAGR